MAYIYCPSCEWEQDDFWTESYNPVSNDLMGYHRMILNKALLDPTKRTVNLDYKYAKEVFGVKDGKVKVTDLLAYEFDQAAKRIKNMHWLTEKDYKDELNKVCPNCGFTDLRID